MRPSVRWCLSLAAWVVLASGCGKARSNPPDPVDPNDVLAAGTCFPLGHAALAESLAEPLAVGRDSFGTLYALSRAGGTTLLWRSWDDRLIPYPVVAENRALGGAIFGADDGNRGYALTLLPEDNPSTLRVFHDLELARPNEGFAFTTGGATLEVLGAEALADFTVASELSPALVAGSFRTVPDDAPSASLLVVRTGPEADAELALFYGQGTELDQRELLEVDTIEPERITVRFLLDSAEAIAHLSRGVEPATGRLLIGGVERALQRGLSTPLGLEQLSLRCLASAPAAWLRPQPALPPAAESCAEALPLFACASTTGPRVAGAGPTLISIEAAQVVELGSGESGAAEDFCSGRATLLLDDPRVNVRWARLESATGQHWLTVAGPELELPFEVGQLVSLYSVDDPGFSWLSWDGEVRVRSAEDETLLLWMGQRAHLRELDGSVAFELLPGPERCVTRPECGGAVSGYALAARPTGLLGSADTGQGAQLVGYGERIRHGDYHIYNGGLESLTALPLCTYKPAGNARIAIWKAPGD
jgi:hypothetical protein